MICADERKTAFPFDVQHRAIIKYVTESPSDFVSLKNQIRDRLVAMMEKRDALGSIGTIASVTQIEGLEQFEIAALVAVAQQMDGPDDDVSAYIVRQDMENAGFTKLAATLGLRSLLDKGLLTTEELADVDGSRYTAYHPTTEGVRWLFANRDKLTLKTPPRAPADDDIPF